ncbi:hypothetical protein TRFO_27796 [Tritrichomonas foetus]|uniref:Uncharacterized protein n=1 Tax=Tritrichomonas foetus TaxID=1144522 RepID=A0A1J4K4H5_9EUKA|nr:hypothetical protein TRFO_27796 [Tritrichomonas foetus]|eukprot:OHT04652.1 hypothetical protein TRFO_27796 [Tritrichomonas foetus]
MDRLGLICQSLRDYIYFKENNFENRAYFPFIVPINSLKDSLGDQFLANTSKRKCRLSTIIDIYNNEDLEFCVYLSIDECYFTIPEDISITNLFEFASKIMDHISTYPHIKFIAFIDDYFIWYKLKKLCNFHSNLLVCPTLSLDYTKCVIWKTSSLRSFILTPGHFLADYSLTSNHAQFIRELCMRNSCVYLKCNNDEIKYMIDN